MKSRIKKILVLIIAIGIIGGSQFMNIAAASATFTYGSTINWMRATKISSINSKMGQLQYGGSNPQIFASKILYLDKKAVYCLEPHRAIFEYSGRTFLNTGAPSNAVKELPKATQERLWKIAYYGYGYPGHDSNIWWGAAQQMIYEALGWSVKWYKNQSDATNQKNEVNMKAYTNEIERLIASHDIAPSFAGQELKLNVGESITLTDTNEVLDRFLVEYQDNVSVTISGQSMTIKLLELPQNPQNNTVLIFKRISGMRKGSTYVWHCQGSSIPQKLYDAGNANPFETYLVLRGETLIPITIVVSKLDRETRAPLAGATFELYDVAEPAQTFLIGKAVTDEKGRLTFSNVDYHGYYKLVETKLPEGYDYAFGEKEWLIQPSKQTFGPEIVYEVMNDLRRLDLKVLKCDEDNHDILLNGAFFRISEVEPQSDGSNKTIEDLGIQVTGAIYLQDEPGTDYVIYSQEALDLLQRGEKVAPNYSLKVNNDGELLEYPSDGKWYVIKNFGKKDEELKVFTIQQGMISLHGLKYGHYYQMCEVWPPLGYQKLKQACSVRQLISDYGQVEYEVLFSNERTIVPKTGN